METMINVIDKLCEKCNLKRALYNYKGKTGGIYCVDHKLENMVNVKLHLFSFKTPALRAVMSGEGDA